jgi:hypothetical protein
MAEFFIGESFEIIVTEINNFRKLLWNAPLKGIFFFTFPMKIPKRVFFKFPPEKDPIIRVWGREMV